MTQTPTVPPATDERDAVVGTLGGDTQSRLEQSMLGAFIIVPFLALVVAIPLAWGWLARLARRRRSRSSCTPSPGTASPSASTATSPTVVQGEPPAQDRPGHRRLDGDPGAGGALGGRPPQAPQVLRPRRRPALPLAVRRERAGSHQGPLLRPHGLAVRRRADPARPVRAGPAARTATSCASRARSRARPRLDAASRDRRRPLVDVLAGRGDGLLLGVAGSGCRCCTT